MLSGVAPSVIRDFFKLKSLDHLRGVSGTLSTSHSPVFSMSHLLSPCIGPLLFDTSVLVARAGR